jgi:hypothetical protein
MQVLTSIATLLSLPRFELEEDSATDFGHVTVDVTINGLIVLVRRQR